MPDDYNSNSVGHSVPGGGAFVFMKPDASNGGTFVVESINFDRDGNAVLRSNNEGGAGGFAIPATKKQVTGNITIQIPSDTEERPDNGWYCDSDFGRGEERIVLSKVSDPYQAGISWVVTADFLVDHFTA